MKRSGLGFEKSIAAVTLALVLASLSSCSPRSPQGNRYQLPWFDKNGNYGIQVVDIKTYDEPQFFRGQDAQVLVEPTDATGELTGERPVGRYIRRADGVIVPADQDSLMATTVYAHFERLHEIDEKMGVQLKWPATIGIEAQINDGQRNIRDNALYDGRYDALLIVPTESARIPVALNGGVIAHEHFHGIFQSLVLKGLPQTKQSSHECTWAQESNDETLNQIIRSIDAKNIKDIDTDVSAESFNSFLLRSLNEGLADYWAWIYTGDPEFISHSLSREKKSRTLNESAGKLPPVINVSATLKYLESQPQRDKLRAMMAYRLGTQYARFMRSMSIKLSGHKFPDFNQRSEVARALIRVLPRLHTFVEEKYTTEAISPDALVDFLSEEWSKAAPDACKDMDTFSSSGKATGCKP